MGDWTTWPLALVGVAVDDRSVSDASASVARRDRGAASTRSPRRSARTPRARAGCARRWPAWSRVGGPSRAAPSPPRRVGPSSSVTPPHVPLIGWRMPAARASPPHLAAEVERLVAGRGPAVPSAWSMSRAPRPRRPCARPGATPSRGRTRCRSPPAVWRIGYITVVPTATSRSTSTAASSASIAWRSAGDWISGTARRTGSGPMTARRP